MPSSRAAHEILRRALRGELPGSTRSGRHRLWLPGRNGAGKSTTIKMLLGMAQPSFGRAGSWATRSPLLPPEVRGRIAYLAEGHPLYGWMTVAEAVRFTRSFHTARWNQPMLDQILDHFEIPPARSSAGCPTASGSRRPGPGDRPRSRPAHPR